MDPFDTLMTVLKYNEAINEQNHEKLSEMMDDDYLFIDRTGKIHNDMVKGWMDFFNNYPDYRNVFTRVQVIDNLVVMAGYATCSYPRLDGPFLWSAKVKKGKISEWRVYWDTPENRENLGLS